MRVTLVLQCMLGLLGWYRFKRWWFRELYGTDLFDRLREAQRQEEPTDDNS